jgi:hypothetical protein
MKYNEKIVTQWFATFGIPVEAEYRFHPTRKFRFDFAIPASKVALEVQGGLFNGGRHTRGAALLKEYEKMNLAACAGWRILYCVPNDLCTAETILMVERAIRNDG